MLAASNASSDTNSQNGPRFRSAGCSALRRMGISTTPPVPAKHRAAAQLELRATWSLCLALLIFVTACPAFAQAANQPPPVAASESNNSTAEPQFQVGIHGAIAPGTRDLYGHLYAGLSATYALRPWLAVGTEIDSLITISEGADTYTAEKANPNSIYIHNGVQTLALGEVRLPLGHHAVRLFGRAAVGPAFLSYANNTSAVVLATRASAGLDLLLWHFYVRPFGLVGTIASSSPQLGFGLEAGIAL